MESKRSITNKEFAQAVGRSILLQGTFNYERYQGSGWVAMMAPFLKKFYGNDEKELREVLKDNSGFFNTQAQMAMFLQGLLLSMYETKQDRSLINNLRVSLFGPLAGIGDSIFWFTLMPIMAGICSSIATEGNILGPVIYFVVYILVFLSKYLFIKAGYKMGISSIELLGEKTRDLSTAAAILGCTVIGGLVATMISFSITLSFNVADDVNVSLQEAFFDQIIPGLLPILITLLMYKLLKKKVSPTKLVVGIIVVCLLLSLCGVI